MTDKRDTPESEVSLGLEITDVAIGAAPGDTHVTFNTPFFSWRIAASSARLLGKALLFAAENIERRAAPQHAEAPAAERVM